MHNAPRVGVASGVGDLPTAYRDSKVAFWLAELRSPAFLVELVAQYPDAAERSSRAVVRAVLRSDDVDAALAIEQAAIMAEDRVYWAPLRRELEALRHQARSRE